MVELTRRGFLQTAAALAGGMVLSEALPSVAAVAQPSIAVPSTLNGAPAILKELIVRYTPLEDDPWALMHGLRAIGRDFTIKGGSAVEFLCSRFLKRKTVGGKSYLYMPQDKEGHTNAFLKTILEAGVSPSRSFKQDGRRYAVRDLVSGAKALFVFDPKTVNRDDLAWTLIAFSLQTAPSADSWTNAYGQRVRFGDVVSFAFDTLDDATRQLRSAKEHGALPETKDKIHDFTCGGTHLIYGAASCVGNGHRRGDLAKRLKAHMDLLVWRLEADGHLMERFYRQAPAPPRPVKGWEEISALYQLDARLKFYGHSFEILSFAKRRRLFTPTPAQARAVEKAGATLADVIKGIRGIDLFKIRKANMRLFQLLVGDCCHAYHGLHMVPGVNQV